MPPTGAILTQIEGETEHLIYFYSKKLLDRERRYSTNEKELLAIVAACKFFYPYLIGQKFKVHCALQPLDEWQDGWIPNVNWIFDRIQTRSQEWEYGYSFASGMAGNFKHKRRGRGCQDWSTNHSLNTSSRNHESINYIDRITHHASH